MDLRIFVFKNRFFYLLLALLLFFLSNTFFMALETRYILNIFLALIVVVSVFSIRHEKKYLFIGLGILGLLFLVFHFSSAFSHRDTVLNVIQTLLATIFFAVMAVTTLVYTFDCDRITVNSFCGAVCAYLLIGLTWSYGFDLIFFLNHVAFQVAHITLSANNVAPTFIYYSFVTLSTLGFGDITPVSYAAKTFSWFEAITGQIYLTVLMAQLVGLYISGKNKKQ